MIAGFGFVPDPAFLAPMWADDFTRFSQDNEHGRSERRAVLG